MSVSTRAQPPFFGRCKELWISWFLVLVLVLVLILFCFGHKLQSFWDRNSAKYKNINNDIMWFLLCCSCCCWCRETVAFFLILPCLLCSDRFSLLFCLTFIDALWPTHSQTNRIESNRIECKCSVNMSTNNVQTKTANAEKITGSISYNIDEPMSSCCCCCCCFFPLFFPNALVYTNKTRNAYGKSKA